MTLLLRVSFFRNIGRDLKTRRSLSKYKIYIKAMMLIFAFE